MDCLVADLESSATKISEQFAKLFSGYRSKPTNRDIKCPHLNYTPMSNFKKEIKKGVTFHAMSMLVILVRYTNMDKVNLFLSLHESL